ncbi:MAG: bifunctional oligoribonuclease/PAP phosphatase NrnA [Candidatus Omnitrophica bacterium]|nr:bifunctional oligoribonuclease/PAP phosphatase NrnA [Candidatus Omnitrophota bacterium]
MSLKSVINCIEKNKYFLITTHTNLEGDALGSELSFYNLLRRLGKKAELVNEDRVPLNYEFLPYKDKIRRLKEMDLKGFNFDYLVILDCSDLTRTGNVYKLNSENKPILNIDHHISNEKFGRINWVDPEASSTAEMVYRLYKAMKVSLDKNTAILLYTGILTDTGSFRYLNTTSFTHRAVSDLLRFNLDIGRIYKNVYENIPFEEMQVLSKILAGMKCECNHRIIWLKIEKELLKKKLSFDLTEYVLNFCRAIKGAEVVVLFKENLGIENEIRVNFRSTGKIDVNKLAGFFGGGGHKTASGVTIKGGLESVIHRVLRKIEQSLR